MTDKNTINTIEVTLHADGSIRSVAKDFILYQGQFNNVLIVINCPKSIIASKKTAVALACQKVNAFGKNYTSSKVNAIRADKIDSVIGSKYYYANYVKDVTINDTVYSSYQRLMPSSFTQYNGKIGVIANIFTLNDEDKITNILVSAPINLDVEKSKYFLDEPTAEMVDNVQVAVNTADIVELYNKKQDKLDVDINFLGGNKEVVGSLNYLNEVSSENTRETGLNRNAIESVKQRLDTLEILCSTSDIVLGSFEYTQTELPDGTYSLPTNEELNAKAVEFLTLLGLPTELKNGYSMIVTIKDSNGVALKYVYANNDWTYFTLNNIVKAENGVYGTIKGNDRQEGAFYVNIQNGLIEGIYFSEDGGRPIRLENAITANKSMILRILNGTAIVGRAKKADIATTANGDDKPINVTYARKDETYSKVESDNRFAPKRLVKTYNFNKNNGSWVVDVNKPSSVQSEAVTVDRTDEAILIDNAFYDVAKLGHSTITSETTDITRFNINTLSSASLHFILRIFFTPKSTALPVLVSAVETDNYSFIDDETREISIESVYNKVAENDVIEVKDGDTLMFQLAVKQNELQNVSPVEVVVYSYPTNPSIYRAVITSSSVKHAVIDGFVKIGLGDTGVEKISFVDAYGNEAYRFKISATVHGLEPSQYYMTKLFKGFTEIYAVVVIRESGTIEIISYEDLSADGYIIIADGQRSK